MDKGSVVVTVKMSRESKRAINSAVKALKEASETLKKVSDNIKWEKENEEQKK